MIAPASNDTPKQTRPNLRPETATKWEAIAAARRWTLAETADALADFYIERNNDIECPSLSGPSEVASLQKPAANPQGSESPREIQGKAND